jgi:hypothetical protein
VDRGEFELPHHRSSLVQPWETNGRVRGDSGVEGVNAVGWGAVAIQGTTAAGGALGLERAPGGAGRGEGESHQCHADPRN